MQCVLPHSCQHSHSQLVVEQVDTEGNPFFYLKRLVFGGVVSKTCIPRQDPLECEVPAGGGEVKVHLELQGHYGEPDVTLDIKVTDGTGKWED